MEKICSVDGCNNPVTNYGRRGMCGNHYYKLRKYGSVDAPTLRLWDGCYNKYQSEYKSWSNAIQRCTNPNNKSFPQYGGRGIKVCERWARRPDGFQNFMTDMGKKPDSMTLDRIDPDGNYCPENCRWADIWTQSANQRRWNRDNHFVGVRFVKKHQKWSAFLKINHHEYSRLCDSKEEAIKKRKELEKKYINREC